MVVEATETTEVTGLPFSDGDITRLLGPANCLSEKWRLVTSYVKTRGLVKQQIQSFNYFVTQGMQKILKVKFLRIIGV